MYGFECSSRRSPKLIAVEACLCQGAKGLLLTRDPTQLLVSKNLKSTSHKGSMWSGLAYLPNCIKVADKRNTTCITFCFIYATRSMFSITKAYTSAKEMLVPRMFPVSIFHIHISMSYIELHLITNHNQTFSEMINVNVLLWWCQRAALHAGFVGSSRRLLAHSLIKVTRNKHQGPHDFPEKLDYMSSNQYPLFIFHVLKGFIFGSDKGHLVPFFTLGGFLKVLGRSETEECGTGADSECNIYVWGFEPHQWTVKP